MVTSDHKTYVYVGLAGEGDYIGEGGIVRRADGDEQWQDISKGLPDNAQVRALAIRPDDPSVVFAGTDKGVFRSRDRGETWEALNDAGPNHEVWSLVIHPENPDVILAGYDPCSVSRSQDGGDTWTMMDTSQVVYPHITTYMPPTGKRVIGMSFDPSNTQDIYAAIEVGGLLASRDGGETWVSVIDGPYLKNNTLDLHKVQVSAAAPGTVHIATQTAMFRRLRPSRTTVPPWPLNRCLSGGGHSGIISSLIRMKPVRRRAGIFPDSPSLAAVVTPPALDTETEMIQPMFPRTATRSLPAGNSRFLTRLR